MHGKGWRSRSWRHGVSAALLVSLFGTLAWGVAPDAGAAPASSGAYHWGSFFGDKLQTTKDQVPEPSLVGLPAAVTEVATSNSTQYALLANGTVYAWGQGDRGELGDGNLVNSFSQAVQVQFPAGVTIKWLPTDAMPYDTAFAVDTTGHVWGWGLDSAGELCLGHHTEFKSPVELGFSDVTAMAGAGDHALYDSAGTVYACGGNAYGDLGDGTTTPIQHATPVKGLSKGSVTTLVASYNDSGALLADGTYLDWGYDGSGQLGVGAIGQASSVPREVSLPAPVKLVVQGGSIGSNGQTLVKLADGSMWAWGDDHEAQLGDDRSVAEPSPIPISPPAGVTYTSLATGGVTSYGVTASGDMYAWGGGTSYQIGDGGQGPDSIPVRVLTGVSQISSTANDVAALAG